MNLHIEHSEKVRLREATTIITAGGIINGILGVVKIALGNFTGYLPLIASGVHSLSDIVSDVVAWVAVLMGSQSKKQREDLRFHYGRRRVETLLSLFAAFLLAFVSVELILSAFGYHGHGHGHGHGMSINIVEKAEVPDAKETHGHEHPATPDTKEAHSHEHPAEAPDAKEAHSHEHPAEAPDAKEDHGHEHPVGHDADFSSHLFLVSVVIIVSIIAKEILFRITRRKGIGLNSPMLIAKAWHHRADSASAFAVLLSIFISSYFPAFSLINQITTIVIASLILHSAWEVGSSAVKELIDFAPSLKVIALVEEMAEKVEAITFTHNIRIRTMGSALYVELTAEVEPDITISEGHDIVKQVRENIMDQVPNVIDVTTLLTPKGEYVRQFMDSET